MLYLLEETMSTQRSRRNAFLMLTVVALWACGGGSDAPESGAQPGEATATVPPPAGPTIIGGTFTTTISAEEAAKEPKVAGTWDVNLAADGNFSVRQGENVMVQGIYTTANDQVTFNDVSGPAMCKDHPTGTYRWALSGNQLTMTVVEDTCVPRQVVLTTRPLTTK
jgi:hypothetical protein